MASLSKHALALVLGLSWIHAAAVARAAESAERPLWTLWALHQKEATNGDHQAVVAACDAFDREHAGSPLCPVSRGLAAWHLLRAGATGEAVRVFDGLDRPAGTNALGLAGQAMALRWLTRLDREQVRVALRAFYNQNIRYPDSLAELQSLKAKAAGVPLADRWKKPWRYSLVKLKHLQKLRNQQYELESTMLAQDSDLTRAVAAPYAARIGLHPAQMSKGGDGRPAIMFETTGKTAKQVMLVEGTDYEGISLVYIGETMIVLSDGDCWQVLAKPILGE